MIYGIATCKLVAFVGCTHLYGNDEKDKIINKTSEPSIAYEIMYRPMRSLACTKVISDYLQ